MHTESVENVAKPITRLSPRYLSSEQLVVMLDLLMELRELTLSRATLRNANSLIVEVGGADRLACDSFVLDDCA